MKGKYGVSMQAHSRFKTKEEYWKWIHCKNNAKPKKIKGNEPLKDGESKYADDLFRRLGID